MKINRRGFFAALLAPLLGRIAPPDISGELVAPALDEILEEADFDEISVTTLALLARRTAFFDTDVLPIWSGEVFPTYGSIVREIATNPGSETS